jgi:hypothetical protein
MKLEYKKYKNINASYTFEGGKTALDYHKQQNKQNLLYGPNNRRWDNSLILSPFIIFFNRNNLSGT